MLFNSAQFLVFFPIVLLVYFALPLKIRQYWLLIASYYFYMCWNPKFIFLILTSTIITYLCGILLEKIPNHKKLVLASGFIINLGILAYFKYFNFGMELIQAVCNILHIQLTVPTFDIILPVGISFFTFQALGYTMDVYRGEIYAEKNFFRYALFVSFFPQLVAGPIERSRNLLKQLATPQRFNFERLREGFLLMLWGYFLKIVLADRIAIFVDTVFGDLKKYHGFYIIIAVILFAVQIYCDFGGYSTIAIGAAKILGISLMENFDAPYISTSVADFWRRWHISLTSWFKDYLYFPLGGSRKGKFRKYLNKLIVFLVSGLWHGASLSFVIWGGLNGIYQVVEEMTQPLREKICKILHINVKTLGHQILQMIITFILVDFSWLFFRANDLTTAKKALKQMLKLDNSIILFNDALYKCGLNRKNFNLMLFCIGILLFADICKRKNINIRQKIIEENFILRCVIISFCALFILVFGKYGPSMDVSNFIYCQF